MTRGIHTLASMMVSIAVIVLGLLSPTVPAAAADLPDSRVIGNYIYGAP